MPTNKRVCAKEKCKSAAIGRSKYCGQHKVKRNSSSKSPHKSNEKQRGTRTTKQVGSALCDLLAELDALHDREALLEHLVDLLEGCTGMQIPSASRDGVVAHSTFETFLFDLKQTASESTEHRKTAQNVRVKVLPGSPGPDGGGRSSKASSKSNGDSKDSRRGNGVANRQAKGNTTASSTPVGKGVIALLPGGKSV